MKAEVGDTMTVGTEVFASVVSLFHFSLVYGGSKIGPVRVVGLSLMGSAK